VSRGEKLAALRAAIAEAHRRGVTSVQTASGSAEDLELLDALRTERALNLRVYAALSVQPGATAAEIAALDDLRRKYADDPLFKAGAIKLMADGVVEAHTAALLEPYANRPSSRGDARWSDEELQRIVTDLDERGWQVMIHAIGDRAIRMALDAFAAAADANPAPERGRRHRIEHIETPDPADIPRFGRLGVIASMQPSHGLPDRAQIAVWSDNLGPERAARGWSYGSILRQNGLVAFGSDWPVATIDPIVGLHVAVNRTTPEGEPDGGWNPAERIALDDAIEAYTRAGAWASFDEHRKGTLARDMLADMVILTRDVFGLHPGRLAETDVAVTIFGGRVVYQRSTATDD
jgi:predicted amidohydrolase YtcJ